MEFPLCQTPSQGVCVWCARIAFFFCARKGYVKAKSSGATRARSLCFISDPAVRFMKFYPRFQSFRESISLSSSSIRDWELFSWERGVCVCGIFELALISYAKLPNTNSVISGFALYSFCCCPYSHRCLGCRCRRSEAALRPLKPSLP